MLLEHGGLGHLVDVGADVLGNRLRVRPCGTGHGHESCRRSGLRLLERVLPRRQEDRQRPCRGPRRHLRARLLRAPVLASSTSTAALGRASAARRVIGSHHRRAHAGERDGELLVVLCRVVLELTWQDMRSRARPRWQMVPPPSKERPPEASSTSWPAARGRAARARAPVIALGMGRPACSSRSSAERSRSTSHLAMVVRHGRLMVLPISPGTRTSARGDNVVLCEHSAQHRRWPKFSTLEVSGPRTGSTRGHGVAAARSPRRPCRLRGLAHRRPPCSGVVRGPDLASYDPVLEGLLAHDRAEARAWWRRRRLPALRQQRRPHPGHPQEHDVCAPSASSSFRRRPGERRGLRSPSASACARWEPRLTM